MCYDKLLFYFSVKNTRIELKAEIKNLGFTMIFTDVFGQSFLGENGQGQRHAFIRDN